MATAEVEEKIEKAKGTEAEAPTKELTEGKPKAKKKAKAKTKGKRKAKAEPEAAKAEEKPKAKAKKKAKTKGKRKASKEEKGEKPAKEKKAKKPAKTKGKRLPDTPRLKRGWEMNKWEKWLCQFFEQLEEDEEVHNAKITKELTPYVKEQGGPDDVRRIVLNSVRRLVEGAWIERSSRGSYKVTGKLAKVIANKAEIAERVKAAREKTPWSRQNMADLLGHPSRGRYGTLEQGRRAMHIWEAHTLSSALNVDIP